MQSLLLAACAADAPSPDAPPEYDHSNAYDQQVPAQVDLLLVVDDSHSMLPYQTLLGAEYDALVGPLEEVGIDYRIGVTTTDTLSPGAGQINDDVVTPDTPDASDVFKSIVSVGTAGAGTEMGLEAARVALEEVAPEFLRPEAALSILVLSDEEDSSPLSVNEYVRRFRQLKGGKRDSVRISTAALFTREACPVIGQEGTPGYRYIFAAAASGGVAVDLCTPVFSEAVAEVAANVIRLRDTFFLAHEPDAASIRLEVDGDEVTCGPWSYGRVDRRPAIVFAEPPAVGARIAVYYNAGSGETTECVP